MKRKLFIFLISLVLVVCSLGIASASTGSTSVSGPSSVTVGNSITLTIKFSGNSIFAGNTFINIDNTNVLSITGSGKGNLDSFTSGYSYLWEGNPNGSSSLYFTITVYAKSAGTAKISISTEGATDSEGNEVNYGSTSYTIKVNNPAKSGNCDLQSLTTSSGTLYPSFSTDVTSYSVTVEYSTEEVVLGYSLASSSANAKISGSNSLKVGENKRTITITAENGTTKEYIVNIIRAAENGDLPDGTNYYQIKKESSLGLTINGLDYMILDDFSGIKIPEGYIEDVISYNGFDIPVLHPKKTNIYLVFATLSADQTILSNDNATVNLSSNDGEVQGELEDNTQSEEISNDNDGVWLFYDSLTGKISETYSLTSQEVIDQTNYLLFGDEEPVIEPEPSAFDDEMLLFIISGSLGVLFITIIILQIRILSKKNKTKRKKKKMDKDANIEDIKKEEPTTKEDSSLGFRSQKRKDG